MDIFQIDYELGIQKNYLSLLQECLKNINFTIQNTDYFENSTKVTELLKDVKQHLDNCRSNISNLESLKEQINNLPDDTSDNSEPYDFNNLLKSYTNLIQTNSISLNAFLLEYIKNTSFIVDTSSQDSTSQSEPTVFRQIPFDSTVLNELNRNNTVNQPSPNNIASNGPHDNKVLLISERKNKVFLPYTIEELNKILERNRSFRNLQEIIDKKYTVPLNKYKNATISRFKETYNLMKREKASIIDSLDLALELAFNAKLNPAVITACKNLEQLDMYLDCLELDELNKFEFFEVKYEFLPTKK